LPRIFLLIALDPGFIPAGHLRFPTYRHFPSPGAQQNRLEVPDAP
jgi:hypothetical protein